MIRAPDLIRRTRIGDNGAARATSEGMPYGRT